MKTLEPVLFLVTCLLFLIGQMVYFLKDDRTENHTKVDLFLKRMWHLAAGGIHLWCATIMGRIYGWEWGVLTLSCIWFFFDGAINTWVLQKEWFAVGKTALTDIAQQKIGQWFHTDPRSISAVIKWIVLIGSIINVFVS